MAVDVLSARVLLDEDVHPSLAVALRRHGFDAVTALELGLGKASDETHLTVASEAGRAIITHDFPDYSALATEWLAVSTGHCTTCAQATPA